MNSFILFYSRFALSLQLETVKIECTLDWLYSLFVEHSALQAVVVLSLISAIGLGLGKIHVCGISLGVTFVFFAGIIAGHFGLSIDPQMLNYAESFGW